MTEKIQPVEFEFLFESNKIENEWSQEALEDAITAWKYFKNKGNPMFHLATVLHTHYLLMKRVRPDIAGKLRDCDVFIGGHRKVFISEQLLKDSVNHTCESIFTSTESKTATFFDGKEKYIKDCHIQFEHIHPFEDGNGRVGRIIYNAHRLKLNFPIHVIMEKDKKEYYRWFSGQNL